MKCLHGLMNSIFLSQIHSLTCCRFLLIFLFLPRFELLLFLPLFGYGYYNYTTWVLWKEIFITNKKKLWFVLKAKERAIVSKLYKREEVTIASTVKKCFYILFNSQFSHSQCHMCGIICY